MPERDPLEAFKSAWRELEAPAATPEEGDAETEAALEWMRRAWRTLEPPPAVVPFRLRVQPLRRQLPVLGRLAAAAAILAIASVLARVFLGGGARSGEVPIDPPPEQVARVVIEAPEEGALVMQHGSVRLVMLVPETTFEAFEPDGNLEQTRMENPR